MYLFSYALKNIVRNRGRYLLIGAVLTGILTAITISAMIHFTTDAVIDDYSERFAAKVTFTPDLRKLLALMEPDENGAYHDPVITTEQYLAFSESDAVKATLFYGSRQTWCERLSGLDQGGEERYYESDKGHFFEAALPVDSVRRQAPNTTVIGFSDSSMMEEFSLGLREIDEGRIYEDIGECMVSREFADLNGLVLGDGFELQDVNYAEAAPLRLTVCGIYLDITTPQPDGTDWAVNNRRNEILTGFSTLEKHGMDGLYVRADYYLKNPDLASEFEAYVRENGLHEVYRVNVDAESYNRIVKPVKSLKSISVIFLTVILLAGGLILVLLSMLGVRERKYEIGVLRAMGMPKRKVAVGLLCESACVLVLCLSVGLGGGSFLAQPVSNVIMERQTELAEHRPQVDYGESGSNTEGIREAAASALEGMKIGPAPESVGFVVMISMALGLLANAAGIFHITKYEPMKILSERS